MNSSMIQLLVLAGIAIFLVLRLKSVLGTREGFEKPRSPATGASAGEARRDFDVIEGGPDRDIVDHVEEGSEQAEALARMKGADNEFSVGEFLHGARAAYEMILMGFERGNLEDIRTFLADDVFESFQSVIQARQEQGLEVNAEFIGVREASIADAVFDPINKMGQITLRFVGELTLEVHDASGEVIEGNARQAKKQRDVWTFGRKFNSDDPNWQLIATGE